ncbi:MAG: glycosyltransferase family 2 protein [Deltaproteobacteria bacterium]|nr:glycosyltransferase family 2 protein [Deltaproteobacteria bacterium]
MLNGKKIIVVLPAYNAEKTLERTVSELDRQVVDEILLVDDYSRDHTVNLARSMGIRSFLHDRNYGYGRNQKTCYAEALKSGADVIVMLHPDYQYSPRLVPAMAAMIVSEEYDLVMGSRILGGKARKSGMPLYKYISNRALTFVENLLLGSKLSEFHTGYRAFSKAVLECLPMHQNSDDFMFDNEMLAQAIFFDFNVGEISCPTRYFREASSINFRRSVIYGFGVLWTAIRFKLQKMGIGNFRIFDGSSSKTPRSYYTEVE